MRLYLVSPKGGTSEELSYIYDLILRSYDDSSILAEYAASFNAGTLMFPYRTDKRFVKERRKELEAAKRVLKDAQVKADPNVVEQQNRHSIQLIDMLELLLTSDDKRVSAPSLVNISHVSKQSKEFKKYESIVKEFASSDRRLSEDQYVVVNWPSSTGDVLSKSMLIEILKNNVRKIKGHFSTYLFDECLIPHIITELSSAGITDTWDKVVEEQPYELIQVLKILAAKKTFNGKCPICKDW